ncbi:MAG: cell division protein FtsQ/DivIB [Candidatus Aminicenantales bacterium]
MAVSANTALNPKHELLSHRSLQFRRPKERVKPKKMQKRFRVRFIHILLTFLLIAGLFFLIQQTYLFLITWDNLDVERIEVDCKKTFLKEEILQSFKGKNLGNILLLDIDQLQNKFKDHRWVKDVRVRKIFPSSLKIEIRERVPAAVVRKENHYLIDRDGILLEKINPQERKDLPLFVDANHFKRSYQEKLHLAWECLESLPSEERKQVELLDLSEYANVTIKLKGEETRLKLGADHFSRKLQIFRSYRTKLEALCPLEYVDLRFDDRLYIKPRKSLDRDSFPIPEKEER